MSQSAAKATNELQVGQKAPDFTLPCDGGGSISLLELRGKQVVLYFYPKDDTPGCTIEAKDFAALYPEFEKANAIVLGVSKDDVKSHDKFKEKYCLSFPLLSDDGTICNAYGTWKQKSMFGKKYMGIERVTFLINEEGNIKRIWPKVSVMGHAKEVLKAVQS